MVGMFGVSSEHLISQSDTNVRYGNRTGVKQER